MAEVVVSVLGEALLSGFIEVVLDKFLSSEALNLIKGKKLDQELLESLKLALLAAGALLTDAENKQFRDHSVKEWLDDLKDAVYTANDLLDRVFTKVATRNKKVSSFLPRSLNFKDRKIVTNMKKIVTRIEALEKRKYILHLNKETPQEKLSWRTPSTSLIEGEIYGRENDKRELIKLLKDENTDTVNISVIPIVGMGGVGKTTLAQWLYNNEDLMKEFHLKAWVCVSEESEIVKITHSIIKALTLTSCDMNDLNVLQLNLKEMLIGKKFFIVLDDVWKHVDWNSLKKPFQHGMKGSKILVTTRNNEVASLFQTCPPYRLNELSDEYCWFVFANHACFLESNGNSTLEKIGRKIVKKCKGLPLAAQTLGSLLRVKHDVKKWKTILKSEIWDLKDSKIIPALLLSYYDLTRHSKRCFIYCSLYPKDYQFQKKELTLLWMAEDLLPSPKRGDTLEEVGYECFDELASRMFFKQFNTYSIFFVMHDLIHDLATSIAGEFYFRSEELEDTDRMSPRTRHLSYARLSNPKLINVDAIGRAKSLRMLLVNDCYFYSIEPLFNIGRILSEFKCLRVLSFACFKNLDVLPDLIGELIHLRYLDLSSTRIKTLSESISNLYNLQTLKLSYCCDLTVLPNDMQNLVNLRHLDIDGTNLKEMPRGMSKLKNLQHLDYFVVGKHEEENGIMELGELSNIHGSLCISKLENVGCSSEALKARIMDKTHIETLEFKWSTGDDAIVISISSGIERDILDKLQPHKGLQNLIVEGYRGTIFPDWVGHSSYHNMTKVSLWSCSNCCMLPSLGQLPSLKSLEIGYCRMLRSIDEEFYKSDDDHSSLAAPFPSLEVLEFHEMSCWEEWHSSQSNSFPQLKYLGIYHCPKLTGDLPDQLSTLQTLDIENCGKLVSSMFDGITITNLTYLESLRIYSSSDLKSLPCHMNTLLPKLECFEIENCPEIELIGGLPPNLKTLNIWNCDKLKSLPCDLNTLTKLEELEISNCPKIELFPEGGLPPNLKALEITNCEKILSGLSSMGVLEGLTHLCIEGPCKSVKSFPKEGSMPQLPSLRNLFLSKFSSLETLDCKELLHLTFLQRLRITECPKLENMTGERLPASLRQLQIKRCPLLKERCKRKDLQIWPKIPLSCEVDCNPEPACTIMYKQEIRPLSQMDISTL